MNIRLCAAALAMACMLALPATAATVYSQDFETGSAGFSGGAVEGTQGYFAVGAYGNNFYRSDATPSASSQLSLNLAQAVTGTTLQLSLAIIDSWDNGSFCCGPDAFDVKLDGVSVFSAVFDNYLGAGATTAAGLSTVIYGTNLGFNGSFNDAAYRLSLSLGDLSAGAHTLEFVASGPGWQGGLDESVAVDNILITATPVPEPASAALFVLGLGAVGAWRRKRLSAR